MDHHKKQVLLKWWNELSGQKVHHLRELGSGIDIANVLLKCGEGLIPTDLDVTSSRNCISAIKTYLESFYQQSLDDGNLINFQIIANNGAPGPTDAVEMEIGKLLLALLGCVIQDRARDNFIAPALKLDVVSQNVMFGILSVFIGENSETKLYPGFETVLKNKQDQPKITMFSFSPQAIVGSMVRDISSPFRHMSLASPVTPLEVLMASPNLKQRAAIRQKNYECRRLESQLRTEQYLREEFELTLKDKENSLNEKEKTIRDLEKKLAENRDLKYKLDDMENIHQTNQSLSTENDRLRNRIQELHTLQETNRMLMTEKADMLAELEEAKDKLRPLEAIKERDDIFEVKYHKLRLTLPDLETALNVEKEDNKSLKSEVKELKETCEIIRNNCKTYKDKIKDLEEQLVATTEEMVDSCQQTLGEKLSVITEKKYAQLKAETECIQTDLTSRITVLTTECDMLKEALETTQVKCQENQKGLLIKEELLEQCRNELLNYKSTIAAQDTSLREAGEQITSLRTEVFTLTTSLESVRQNELELLANCEENEATLVSLRSTLGTCQADLELKMKELRDVIERHTSQSETVFQLEQKVNEMELCKTQHEQTINELELANSKSEELQKALLLEKEATEGRLKDSQEEIERANRMLQTEREENSETITDLRTQLQKEETENKVIQETNQRLNQEIIDMKKSVEKEKIKLDQAEEEKRNSDEQIHRLSEELSSTKECSEKIIQELKIKFEEKERSLNQELIQMKKSVEEEKTKLNEALDEKRKSDEEIHRLSKDISSTKECSAATLQELKTKFQEKENSLNQEIIEMNKYVEEEKIKLNEALEEKSKSDEEINRLSMDLSSAKESSAKTLQELKTKFQEKEYSLNQEIDSVKSGKRESSIELNRMSEKISNLNKVIEAQHKEIADLTERLKSVNAELINSMQNTKIVTVQYDSELTAIKDKMERDQRQSANERQEQNEIIETLQSKLETGDNQWRTEKLQVTNDMQIEIEKNKEYQEYIVSLEEQIAGYKTQVNDQSSDINRINQELKDAQNEIKTGENARFELEESLRQKATLVQSQLEKMEYLMGVETSLKATIEMLQTDIDTTKNLVAERDDIKAEKNKKIKEVEEALESEQRKVECLVAEQTKLTAEHESKMSRLNEENERLSTLTETLQITVEEVSKKHENTAEELRRVTEILNKESEAHGNLTKEKCTMQDQLDKLVEDKAVVERTLEECKKDHEKQVSELKEKISQNEQYWVEQCEHLREGYDKQISQLIEIKDNHLQVNEQCNNQIEELKKENVEKDEHIQRQAELKQQEIDMLTGQRDQLRLHLTDTHEKTLNTVVAEYQAKVEKLQSEVEEQRVSYQQMISGMEEKLGGEALELRERLSQMKCMYETLIETKEKETAAKISDMGKQRNEVETAHKQLIEENKECTEHRKELEEKIGSVNSELESQRTESKQSMEEMRRQKGEVEEMKRQLQYSREITDTLTAELSSNQQQLAVVEEEKHVLELEAQSLEEKHNLQLEALGKRLDERSLEVEELERQLQASHTCYEAVQKTQVDLEKQVKLDAEDHMSQERKCHELEKHLSNYLERVNKRAADHQLQMEKAAELNGKLQCQLQALTEEKHGFEREIHSLKEREAEHQRDNMQKKLEESEEEIKTLKSVQLKYKVNYNAKKMNIVALEEKLSAYELKFTELKTLEGKLEKEEKRNISLKGTGGIFHCEDEPVEMQWGRLDELKRRNTMCPAHLKTSYPVETQTCKPDKFQERALRESTVGNTNKDGLTGSRRKRKQVSSRDSSDSDSAEGKGKQSKAGCAYHKPGPPTPANQRRNSDRVQQSPGSKSSRSPKTPTSLRCRKYPKRTPRRSPSATNVENSGFAKQTSSQSNVAFNIGFSPETTGSQRPLRRQQAFVQKQPQSSGKVSKLLDFFETKKISSESPALSSRPLPQTPIVNSANTVKRLYNSHLIVLFIWYLGQVAA